MHHDFRPVDPNGARGVFSLTPRFNSSEAGLADGNAFADFLLATRPRLKSAWDQQPSKQTPTGRTPIFRTHRKSIAA
jgi:hypothetical protein